MKKIWFLLLTVVFIFGNYILNFLAIGGRSIGDSADAFRTLLSPADFTFSIWGVIFAALLYIGSVIAFTNKTVPAQILSAYTVVVGLLLGWIFLWQNSYLLLSAIVLVAATVLNFFIVNSFRRSYRGPSKFFGACTQLYLIFATWTLVASVINVTTWLRYGEVFSWIISLDWPQWVWASGVVGLLGFVSLILMWRMRYITFWAVYLWTLWGLNAVSGSTPELYTTVQYCLLGVGILGAVIWSVYGSISPSRLNKTPS